MSCFSFWLPPSDLLRNKHRIAHAYERELSVCLFPRNEYWRYSNEREQELKAQYILYVHFKFMEWKRSFGL